MAAWNIRTLLDPSTSNSCDRPPRRTALVASELSRYKIDIAALSETRLPDEDSLTEVGAGYTFFWRGLPKDDQRIHGVGFAIKTTLLLKLPESPVGISERIMTLRIPLVSNRHATIISAYAPTLTSPVETKDTFYEQLHNTLSSIPRQDKIILLGDFNARVGTNHLVWEGIIGKHGVGNINDNGLRLLNLCASHDLAITNTFFQLATKHKTTWMHPRSKHWHLIDYAITRKPDLQDFKVTRAMRGAECWTDHRMIRSTVKFRIRPPARRQARKKRFNLSKFHDPNELTKLNEALEQALEGLQEVDPSIELHQDELDEAWSSFTTTLFETTKDTIGLSKRSHQDWFDQNNSEIQDLLTRKNNAHLAAMNHPNSPQAQNTFRTLRAEAQRELRKLKNDWWTNKAAEIQGFADKNDHQHFYDAIKCTHGPTRNTQAPLRSSDGTNLIKDQQGILNRWAEYLTSLLNHRNPADPSLLDNLPELPTVNQLDDIPSFSEVHKACKSLKNNKSPGPDGLPGELFKFGTQAVTRKLHKLIMAMWNTGHLPQTLKDANIIMIYKRKGCRSDCSNYRGISLLDIAGKIIALIMLARLLDSVAPLVLPETQCGFRKERSTSDMIFVARLLQEKCREQNKNLYIAFVDLAKAFDTVNREMLWTVLTKFGCPPKFMQIMKAFHDGMTARVSAGGTLSDPFEVTVGVKQGCVLAPVIFNIYMAAITVLLRHELDQGNGIDFRYRLDGSVFNLNRLKAVTKTRNGAIFDLQYADDAAYPTLQTDALQTNLDTINRSYTRAGLAVNTNKTEVMPQPGNTPTPDPDTTFQIGGAPIKNVQSVKYLGSMLTADCSLENEIQNRIRQASASYGKFSARVFKNRDLSITTKVKVYRAICLSILLYSCESWTLYRGQLRRLEAFHIRSLQSILGITWKDKMPHVTILQRTNSTSIEAMIMTRQLSWTGHVIRMPDDRLPKQLLYGELADGQRSVGGQKKRYKDNLKATLKKCNIPPNTLEEVASNRRDWRSATHRGVQLFEEARTNARIAQRNRRHAIQARPPLAPGDGIPCPTCGRRCASEFGLRSHQRVHLRRGQP